MQHIPPHLLPPDDESPDELEWRYGLVTVADYVGWNDDWGNIAAKAMGSR